MLTMAVQFVLSWLMLVYLECPLRCESVSIETVNAALVTSGVVAGITYAALTRLVYGNWPELMGLATGVVIAILGASWLARLSATTKLDGVWAILTAVIVVLTVGYLWLRFWGSLPPKPRSREADTLEGCVR